MKDKTYSALHEERKNRPEFDKIHHLYGEEKFDLTPLAEIICKDQPWFWQGFIPNHTITLFAGNGGVGKSALLLYIAAKTTTGQKFSACGLDISLQKGRVIIMSAEDDPEYQLKPKLIAAGADEDMIDLIKYKLNTSSKKKRMVNLLQDLELMEQHVKERQDIRLIIIDPVGYFVGELRDEKNGEVIHFLDTLKDFAKRNNLAIILNKHLRKKGTNGSGSTSASSEIGGSAAWVTSPRITWIISNDHEDPAIKIISNPKNNLTNTKEECLAYRIIESNFDHNGSFFKSNTIQWENHTYKRSADDALNEESYKKKAQNQAVDFIFNHLKENGISLYRSIYETALAGGVSDRQMKAAKKYIKDNCRDEIKIVKAKYCNGDELTLLDQ